MGKFRIVCKLCGLQIERSTSADSTKFQPTMPFSFHDSPLELIPEHPGKARGISLFIKRDDLLHPEIEGSKGRKLAAVLPQIKELYPEGLVTFGGAFSNHLHAVAVAGRIFGIRTLGILRGEYADLQNPTLLACQVNGMELIRWPKAKYDAFKEQCAPMLEPEFKDRFFLPEGGNTPEAVAACMAIPKEMLHQLPIECAGRPLFICTPAGTGCTAAGIVAGLHSPNAEVLIFPVSSHHFDDATIQALLPKGSGPAPSFRLVHEYTFGGFARLHPPVMDFVRRFYQQTNILPDPIYTGKMLFGVYDKLEKAAFPEESTVVVLHTGGLQGWAGFQQRFGQAGIVKILTP